MCKKLLKELITEATDQLDNPNSDVKTVYHDLKQSLDRHIAEIPLQELKILLSEYAITHGFNANMSKLTGKEESFEVKSDSKPQIKGKAFFINSNKSLKNKLDTIKTKPYDFIIYLSLTGFTPSNSKKGNVFTFTMEMLQKDMLALAVYEAVLRVYAMSLIVEAFRKKMIKDIASVVGIPKNQLLELSEKWINDR